MSEKAEKKIPTYHFYSVIKHVYALHLEDAIKISFTESPGGLSRFSMSLKEAWQLADSLCNLGTINTPPPYALESENAVYIFFDEGTNPTFQMTPEGAVRFRRSLLQELPPIEQAGN